MKRMNTTWRLTPVALALICGAALAQGESSFSFSGFATLGLAQTSTDARQHAIFGQPRGADKSASGGVDSKVGLQLTAKANAMFSATVQVLTKKTGVGNLGPEFDSGAVKKFVAGNPDAIG